MSRSGYIDDEDDHLAIGRWRGAVMRAMYGKRGQAFLKEALAVLDAMPDKRLIAEHLEVDGRQCRYGDPDIIIGGDELVTPAGTALPMGAVCTLGAVGKARGMDMSDIDPEDHETVAVKFGIAHALACEIMYMNDDWYQETPEERYNRMRAWVVSKIKPDTSVSAGC